MANKIYLTHDGCYIYEWMKPYLDPSEYDPHGYRLMDITSRGTDTADPCADDLRRTRSMERKIWNWKHGIKPKHKKA